MSRPLSHRLCRAQGLCVVCKQPNTEPAGQRGPRAAHAHCRKLRDAGVPAVEIVRLVQADGAASQ
jgi:hypothetical protein